MKKNKWCKFRHQVLYFFLRPVFKILFFFKFNFKYQKNKLPDEGALVLCNHTMAFDPFIVACMYNKPLYFMTSKDLFQNKLARKKKEAQEKEAFLKQEKEKEEDNYDAVS